MNILHISASPRGFDSDSYSLADHVLARLRTRHPQARVAERPLWSTPLPQVDEAYAVALAGGTTGGDVATGPGTLARSDELIEELERADLLVIGTPVHNLTVPASLKAWIDHVVRVHRTVRPTPQGKVGMLPDRPVYVAVTSGGWRTGPRARNPDFFEPYLRAVLGMVGLRELVFFSMEGMALGEERMALARHDAHAEVDRHFDVREGAD
jgi:FMN-dependent NADH-azoreductase